MDEWNLYQIRFLEISKIIVIDHAWDIEGLNFK